MSQKRTRALFTGAFVGAGVTGAFVGALEGEGVTGAFVRGGGAGTGGMGVDLADFVPFALLPPRVAQPTS
jgi:hypothetical protein